MKKILILAVLALVMPLCGSAQEEIRQIVPETSLLVSEDPYVAIYDPNSKSRVMAFRSTKEFVVDIKNPKMENEEYRVAFPPELLEEDSFIFNGMNSEGFSITKTTGDPTVLGFDARSRTWILGKIYSSE